MSLDFPTLLALKKHIFLGKSVHIELFKDPLTPTRVGKKKKKKIEPK